MTPCRECWDRALLFYFYGNESKGDLYEHLANDTKVKYCRLLWGISLEIVYECSFYHTCNQ